MDAHLGYLSSINLLDQYVARFEPSAWPGPSFRVNLKGLLKEETRNQPMLRISPMFF